jgi:thiol-disulfide isomerase/thioredoxin
VSRAASPKLFARTLALCLTLGVGSSVLGPEAAAPARGKVRSGSLGDLRQWVEDQKGRPVLLTFWATWCAPCVKEVPELKEAMKRFAPRRLAVMAVSLDGFTVDDHAEGRAKVEEFAASHDLPYDTFYYEGDPDPLSEAYDLPGPIPFAIVLDEKGKVKQRLMGSVGPETFRRRLEEALSTPPSSGETRRR